MVNYEVNNAINIVFKLYNLSNIYTYTISIIVFKKMYLFAIRINQLIHYAVKFILIRSYQLVLIFVFGLKY